MYKISLKPPRLSFSPKIESFYMCKLEKKRIYQNFLLISPICFSADRIDFQRLRQLFEKTGKKNYLRQFLDDFDQKN